MKWYNKDNMELMGNAVSHNHFSILGYRGAIYERSVDRSISKASKTTLAKGHPNTQEES